MNHFARISVFEADEILAARADAMLIDTRDDRFFNESHHPRATHLTDKSLRSILTTTPKNVPILIYCYHGNSSQDIAQMFCDFGFRECYSIDGGYSAWQVQLANEFAPSEALTRWLNDSGFPTDNVNARSGDEKRTPLMQAVKICRCDMVRDLIDAGADPNLTDRRGNNALWYACMAGCLECVDLLINADAEIENCNQFGFSALNYAIGLDSIFKRLSDCISEATFTKLNAPGNTAEKAPLPILA